MLQYNEKKHNKVKKVNSTNILMIALNRWIPILCTRYSCWLFYIENRVRYVIKKVCGMWCIYVQESDICSCLFVTYTCIVFQFRNETLSYVLPAVYVSDGSACIASCYYGEGGRGISSESSPCDCT